MWQVCLAALRGHFFLLLYLVLQLHDFRGRDKDELDLSEVDAVLIGEDEVSRPGGVAVVDEVGTARGGSTSVTRI